ncbi:thiamine transporter 2-like [Styela clava]
MSMDESESGYKWLRHTILLCSFGFFTHLVPSEAFITPYLKGPHKNLTDQELVNQIFPVWSYSYTAFLIPVFLLTDYLRYKPIVILQGLGFIGSCTLLVFAKGVPMMQLMQVSYGLATACSIGYYSYIYSVIEPEYYQKATSYVRTSTKVGLFISALLSQLLVSLARLDYYYLNVISLINVSIGFVISLFLPFPSRSLYFYGQNEAVNSKISTEGGNSLLAITDPGEEHLEKETQGGKRSQQSVFSKWKTVLQQLLGDIRQCYSNSNLLRWSIWWALSTCGYSFVVNYIQNLWEIIAPSQGKESGVYNGAVEGAAQILGAAAAFSVGYIKVDWKKWGEMFLGFGSVINAGLLFVMYMTSEILICYVAYAMFIGLYNFVITIAQFQIAIGLSTERFALVFGINTFAAVVLNSILTLIIVDDAVLGLDAKTQFLFYSVYFAIIAAAYLCHGGYILRKQCHIQRNRNLDVAEEPTIDDEKL